MRCRKDFSLTSGTLFAFHKLALRMHLAAVVIFVNEVKGKVALALRRDLGVQYKTAFVLAQKIRERDGRTVTGVFPSEDAAGTFIRSRVAKGTAVQADESGAWNGLHARCPMHRFNHQDAHSRDGACTDGAESFFSQICRGEIGHHHHLSGLYLHRYAQEAAFGRITAGPATASSSAPWSGW